MSSFTKPSEMSGFQAAVLGAIPAAETINAWHNPAKLGLSVTVTLSGSAMHPHVGDKLQIGNEMFTVSHVSNEGVVGSSVTTVKLDQDIAASMDMGKGDDTTVVHHSATMEAVKLVNLLGAEVEFLPKVLKAKVMLSKYKGKCLHCKTLFPKNTPIAWTKGLGAAHLSCEFRYLAHNSYQKPKQQATLFWNAVQCDAVLAEFLLLYEHNVKGPKVTQCVETHSEPEAHVWGCSCKAAPWTALLGG